MPYLSTVSLTVCSKSLYSSPAGGKSTISGADKTVSTWNNGMPV